jgi:hypothetical protein
MTAALSAAPLVVPPLFRLPPLQPPWVWDTSEDRRGQAGTTELRVMPDFLELFGHWRTAGNRSLAEREGFEPPIRLPVCRISSAVHSTTLPPLQIINLYSKSVLRQDWLMAICYRFATLYFFSPLVYGVLKCRVNNCRRIRRQDQCGPRPIPNSRRGLPNWAARCFQARLPTSASSSPRKPRSGPKW